MKRIVSIILLLALTFANAKADHITGGEMYYTLASVSGNLYTYNVTLKLFMRCNSGRNFPNPTFVSVFDKGNGARINDITAPLIRQENISLDNPDPCISNPPEVCYEVAYYDFSVTLPGSVNGYSIASQVNYRIGTITNLEQNGGRVGALYSTEIPGTTLVGNGPSNKSAYFIGSDLVIVCANSAFTYSFGATDPDGDELHYTFCSAYQSTGGGGPGNNTPPANPPYPPVPYSAPFSGSSPLGGTVSVDPKTGLISGIAPDVGIYVVTVCVDEIRNGQIIATQRKDLQINIANCGLTQAKLEPEYSLCGSTMTLDIANQSTSSLIKSYEWILFDRQSNAIATFNTPTLSYSFADTGLYGIKLIINKNEPCSDSTTSTVFVYPGFKPDFSFVGLCLSRPTQFTDLSTTVYGVVNDWKWNFGETSVAGGTSDLQNPLYNYPEEGDKTVTFFVKNSVGCKDTVTKVLPISDKPPIGLSFKDTTICKGDTLLLSASSSGAIQWTPNINMIGTTGASTRVYPGATFTYYAELNDNGCYNKDSVLVKVVNGVNLSVMNDTTICSTDSIQLRIKSDGLLYQWSPAATFANSTIPNPGVRVFTTSIFTITASIGGCAVSKNINVVTVPYPIAFAGNDTTVCFGATTTLQGTGNGIRNTWQPANLVSNPFILTPTTKLTTTTDFILSVFDNKGCPKPGLDTMTVTVLPAIKAFAGRDTNIVVGQPLQLNATGGVRYLWNPASNLSNASIANPIAIFNESVEKIKYQALVYNAANCVDSASFYIKVFAKGVSVYVPTGFTPNGDGNNDVLRPTLAGISKLEYFSVYNRLGQLVFTTSAAGKGWNGNLNGIPQQSGAFVWIVRVVNYDGSISTEKGTSVLVR